jgi:hypothetical protein
MSNEPSFSVGNKKLSKNILIWNLPRLITCPGAGACSDWCYERKIEKIYKNTIPFRLRNLDMASQSSFAADVISKLECMKQPYVRIHECGDFFNQGYLDKWKEIAGRVRNKLFYSFTKSFHLDLWTNLPHNFQIIQSTGSRWDHLINWNKATNRAKLPKDDNFDFEVSCSGRGCGDTCSLCISRSNIHLAMDLHY